MWSTTGQAVSSLSGLPYDVGEQELGHSSWKSEECSGDVLSDTDDYQTADDEERNISADADVDPLHSALQVRDLQHPVHDAETRQDSSEFESSSSSSEDDDGHSDEKVTDDRPRLPRRRSEPEKRRKSYEFAISKSRGLIPDVNDDDVVSDLDPFEFHHKQIQKTDLCDEDSDRYSDCVPVDLDPREFSHPSTRQPAPLTVLNSNMVVKDGKSQRDREKRSNSERFEGSLHQEALQLSKGCNVACFTERHESVVEGNLLPTIVIPSPTEKILDTDRQEWFVLRCTKRAVFDFSLALEHLQLFTAGESEDVDEFPSQLSTSVRVSAEDEKRVPAGLYDDNSNIRPLPIVEAMVCETTELIRARLVKTATLWESFQFDDMNLSSSPEKYSDYPFEAGVPYPDYGSSMSSPSDTNSEAGDDVAVDADVRYDTPGRHSDRSRSPTPDYDVLSPICEQGMEFGSEPEPAAEVHINSADELNDEVKVDGYVKKFHARQPLFLARKGSQRFSKSVQHSVSTVEPALAEQADESEAVEREQDADVSFEPKQHIEDSCETLEHYRTGVETAPAVLPLNDKGILWQGQAKSQVSSGDQPNLYATLGSSSDKRKRLTKRSVMMYCFIGIY